MDVLNREEDPRAAEEDVFPILYDGTEELDEELFLLLLMAMTCYITCLESFQPIELTRESQVVVNPEEPIYDMLRQYSAMPQLFRDMTNFTLEEFRELCAHVVPEIESNARFSGTRHILRGRPCKLSPEQRLLSFLLYLKHDSIIYLDAARWNWSRSGVCDDALFVASCVNKAIADEIRWPTQEERRVLGQVIPQLQGCIGFVDGTLVKIRRPFQHEHHSKWFNGRKKMYSVNSSVLVDHNGLFIHVDPGYPGSYHDVTILRHSWVEQNWRILFENSTENYCEYVLGDLGYTGMEKYIMRGFSRAKIRTMQIPDGVWKSFNKMHAGCRVRVEWGIGGLKQKWRRMMKRFDLVKPKFGHTFRAAALLTNFLHRRRRDMREHVDGQRAAQDRGWAGDY